MKVFIFSEKKKKFRNSLCYVLFKNFQKEGICSRKRCLKFRYVSLSFYN